MRDPDTHPGEPPVDHLSAIRKWLWRHSSQPNGDPWDNDPEHLDRAAQNLLNEVMQWFVDVDPSSNAIGPINGSRHANVSRRDEGLRFPGGRQK